MKLVRTTLLAFGLTLVAIAVFSPTVLKYLREVSVFSGAWGGFGPFVISLYLQPWIGGCGLLLLLVGLLIRKGA